VLVTAAYTDGQQYINHSSKLLAEELNTTYTQQQAAQLQMTNCLVLVQAFCSLLIASSCYNSGCKFV